MIILDFTKRDTNIAKCFAIILMLLHHLFFSTDSLALQKTQLVFLLIPEHTLVNFSYFIGKVCVSIFIFLTGYGLSVSYKSQFGEHCITARKSTLFCLKRYVSLELNFFFIFMVSFLYACFTERTPFSVYSAGGVPAFNGLVDALGLATGFNTPTLNATWWYMTLAFIAILIFPFSFSATKKFGILMPIFFAVVLPFMGINYEFLTCYIPAMFLGIYAAQNSLFSKFDSVCFTKMPHKKVNRAIKSLFLLVLIMLFSRLRVASLNMPINNTVLAFLMILFTFELLHNSKIVGSVFEYIGAHSMSIFLTHTFIIGYYYADFVYSFRYPIIIFFVSFGLSLAVAVVIDSARKLLQYDKLVLLVKNAVSKKEREIQ